MDLQAFTLCRTATSMSSCLLNEFNRWSNEFFYSMHKSTFFFYLFFFFHKHSRVTGQQGKREAISLHPLYHFYSLDRLLDIRRVITAESSPLHIANSRNEKTLNEKFT